MHCRHERVEAVVLSDGQHVADLCSTCEQQMEPGWLCEACEWQEVEKPRRFGDAEAETQRWRSVACPDHWRPGRVP